MWKKNRGAPGSPSSGQMHWSSDLTQKLLEYALQEQENHNWTSMNLTVVGFNNVASQFEKIGVKVTPKQIKNKFTNLRKDFTTWKNLKQHDTGTGWSGDTIDASDDWWNTKIASDKNAAKFRESGLQHSWLMYRLFQNCVPTGEFVCSGGRNVDDVRTPIRQSEGENDDDIDDMSQVQRNSSSRLSGGKRKSISSAAEDVADAIDSFRTTYSTERKISHINTINDGSRQETKECMDILHLMPEDIPIGSELYMTAIRAFQKSEKRNVWMYLPNNLARVLFLNQEAHLQRTSTPGLY